MPDSEAHDTMIDMKPQQEPSTKEVLAGLVERVTFHNADNGFCVLRIKTRGQRELVPVVGHAAVISAGEWVTASGEWINDHTHGQQFKARFMRTSAPTSIDGIEKYLGSGMIRGIGPVHAKIPPSLIVRASGRTVNRVILTVGRRLPVFPGKRTSPEAASMSQTCQLRTCSRWNCGALRRMVKVVVDGEEEYLAS